MNIPDRSQNINVEGSNNAVGPGAVSNSIINNYVNEISLSEAERSACLASYRQQMLNNTAFVSLAGMSNDRNSALLRMPLEKIFIPVQLLSQEKSKETERKALEAVLQDQKQENPLSKLEQYRRLGEYLYRHKPKSIRKKQNETIADFINRLEQENAKNDAYTAYQDQRRLVFLGPPGSGKSTVLRYIAHKLLSQNPQQVAILVKLRDYATLRNHNQNVSLRDFAINEAAAGDAKLRRALAEVDKPVWLLDALDEAHGWQDEITKQANQLPGDLILTSRPLNYQPGSLISLPHYELQALKLDDIELFLHNWYAQLAEAKGQSSTWVEQKVSWLQKQLKARPAIQNLMSSPLLLTFLVLLAGEQPDIELPQQRADLYQSYVQSLFHTWEQQRQLQKDAKGQRILTFGSLLPADSRRVALRSFEIIAWYLHLAYYDRPSQYRPTRKGLLSYLVQVLQQEVPAQELQNIAEEVLTFWQEAGLLSEWRLQGEVYLTFRHLTFQEYGVARLLEQLWQKDQKQLWAFLKPRLHIEHWRESLLMFGTLLSHEDQLSFVQKLWKGKSAYEHILWRDLRLLLLLWGEGISLEDKLEYQIKYRILRICRANSSFHTSFWLQKLDFITSSLWKDNSVDEEASAYYQHIFGESLYSLPLTTIEIFKTLLNGSNVQVKISAIRQLGELDDERTEPILEQYTNHSDGEVRQAALHMLSFKPMDFNQIKRTFKEVLETFELPESSLLTSYLGKDWHIYFEKVQNSGLVFPEDQAFFESAISMLNSSNMYIRKWGAELLGMIRDSRAYDPLVKLLLVELDKNVRDNIIDSLKKLQKNEVVEILIAEVNKNDNIPLPLIIHSLGKLGDKKALDTLLELLSHNDVQVRLSAVQALGKLDDDRAIDPLINLFKNDSATVRSAVAKSLGSLGNKRVELVLIDHLGDSDQNVRREIIGALGKIGSKKALLPLARCLKDKDVYWAVLSILQELPISNNKKTLYRLIKLLYRNLKRRMYKNYPQDNENNRIFDLTKFTRDSFFSTFLILLERFTNHYEALCLQQRPGNDPLASKT